MEKIDVDLNSLFNLSYNFENLKLLLTTINKNQDIFESKLKDFEKKLDKIQSNPPPKKEVIVEKTGKPFFDEDTRKITRDMQKFKTKRENIKDYDDIYNKIEDLEDKIKLLYNFIPKFPEDETKTLNDILDEHKFHLDNNNTDIKEVKEKIDDLKNTVDKLSVKMNDIDIYDIMKDIQFSGGDIEASKIIVQSLERKTEARFKFMEEKIKDDEQLAQKMKNEIINLKNNSIIQKNNITIVREQMIKLQNEVNSNKRNCLEKIKNNENEIESMKERESKNMENINNQFQNLTLNLYDFSNKNEDTIVNSNKIKIDKIDKIDSNLDKKDESTINKKSEKSNKDEYKEVNKELIADTEREKSDEKEKINMSVSKLDQTSFVNINSFNEHKDLIQKKLNNFERRIQAVIAQIKNDYFQKEINNLKNTLNSRKPTPQEFYDLSVQVTQYSDLYENMKEDNNNLHEELNKINEHVSTLLKSYETLMMKTAGKPVGSSNSENINEKEKHTILSKLNDFVEITVFNEYIKEQTKFSEKIKKDIESYRHFYDEIIETLKKAASVQDLKSLEEYLLDLLEEFKDRTNKFYPKKSEINKNFKALELQIKQIYEYIIKKDENSENWLLAKKPIGGFSCASCESYLGDLKENNEKVIWNQLPERDILTTNTNRIGNGFSRILNLVNVSRENNTKENSPSNNKLLKPDYGSLNNELFSKNKNNDNDETNNNSDNKKFMNITKIKNRDDPKNIFKDFSGNNTKTNYASKQKINFSSEEKLRFTTSDNLNVFKEIKNQKSKKGLPPIIKDDSNVKDVNFSSLFEEIKDGKEKQKIPKVMKIIRKKK